MLLVSCTQINRIIEVFDGKEYDGCKFELVSKMGIQAKFKHNLEDDLEAKDIMKSTFRKDITDSALLLSVQPIKE